MSEIPENLYPIVALRDIAAYPFVIVPLYINRPRSLTALNVALATNQRILLVPQKDPDNRNPQVEDFNSFATVGKIVQLSKLNDGRTKVLVEGICRCRIGEIVDNGDYWSAAYTKIEDKSPDGTDAEKQEISIICEQVIEEFKQYLAASNRENAELIETLRKISAINIGRVADTIAAHMNIEYTDRVKILETLDHLERIELVCNLLDHEQNKLELDNKIKKRVKEQMDKNQREYYLREKIKAVNKELHELEGVENEFDKYAEKIREAKMPKEAEEKAKYELGRLEQMSPSSSDANVCRNYLDWLISYPWSKEDSQQCDLREAEKIFDADHFGLEEVKDRILDYHAVYRRQTEIINRKKAEADWKKAEEAEKNQETQTDSNTHQPQTKIDIIKTDQNIAAQEAISNEKLAYEEEKIALEKAENTADKQEAEEEINQFKSPIICLMGPPGVGKTSLGKSIAKAMGRKFVRIALGGVDDESEIRGHRRTYVAAMPGKIVQKLCKVGTKNPVILLDEIDKIDRTHRGDPAAALLEVLDPAQNNAFNDHYLDLDVDLSQVFFIATANTFNIPTELVDRMEVIRISGYTPSEKREIAKRYLLPRQLEENALKAEEISFSNDLIDEIIEKYTRESGVRNLEREIGKIARKAVRKLETSDDKAIFVDKENLKDFLGTEKFVRSDDDLQPKIGSVTGLAWTSVGGELLQIETAVFSGKGNLNHTGQLGDVMKESIQAALSVVRQTLDKADPDFDFSKYDIHIHLPEGATPKDGPSAGIAMATALLSTLTQKTVRGDIAMTGEITLNGRVLAIGGLKEKLLAAQRGKIKTVLIPKENIKDLRDIPEEVKNELEIIAVEHISEVFSRAFNEPIEPIKAIPVSTTTAISGKMEC